MENLESISRFYSKNLGLRIHCKGSMSYKSTDKIWVKEGSCNFGEKVSSEGFACYYREEIQRFLNEMSQGEKSEKRNGSCISSPDIEKRDVVEFFLHETIPFEVVVHYESSLAKLPIKDMEATGSFHTQLREDDFLYVKNTDNDVSLIYQIQGLCSKKTEVNQGKPLCMVVEGYGIFLSGHSVEDIHYAYQRIEGIQQYVEAEMVRNVSDITSPTLQMWKRELKSFFDLSKPNIVCDNSAVIRNFLSNRFHFESIREHLGKVDPLFDNSILLYLSKDSNLLTEVVKFRENNDRYPEIVCVEGEGVLVISQSDRFSKSILISIKNNLWYYYSCI